MDTFGEWLRGQREKRKLTREEFSVRVGCSAALLRKIENGERRPSAQIAGLMANVLDVPVPERESFIRVARGELGTERLRLTSASEISSPQIKLPILPTPLIGRAGELEKLGGLLRDPHCRMLTLVGPGGIGKTRLAVEAASKVEDIFGDGVYFIPLASANSARLVVPIIADSIGFTFQGTSTLEPLGQLLDYLKGKRIMLVADNLEHLLTGATLSDLLLQILEHAPLTKIIATSREPLNLHGEWIFEVQGLPTPSNGNTAGTSVELFLQRARRANVGFNATTDDYPAILRICDLVDGMPLGVELAAAWVRTLSCKEIAREIEQGLDFLSASAHDLPVRHRSMRAVFDHSWKLLADGEQAVLQQLSIFQGGFTRKAAETIAGASLPMLSGLVTKSLIRRSGEGRYDLHELVRQYAAERMADQPEVRREAQERHGRYYMEYLSGQDEPARNASQKQTLEEISADMENIRRAWDRCVEAGEFDLIEGTLRTFETFFDARGWHNEGLELLNKAEEALKKSGRKDPLAHGHILIAQALMLFRLSQMEPSRSKLEQSIEFLRPLDQPRVMVEAVSFLVVVMTMTGNYKEALKLSHEGIELSESAGDAWFKALNLTEMVNIRMMMGEKEKIHEGVMAAMDAWKATGDPRFTAFGLNTLSIVFVRLGRFDEAQAALQESIAINELIGDRWGLGTSYRGLGLIEQDQGRHKDAIAAFQKGRSILRELGARWDEARILTDSGRSVLEIGDLEEAENIWRESIRIALEVQGTPLILEALLGLAMVRITQGNVEKGMELLSIVTSHPSTVQETKDRARKFREGSKIKWSPSQVESIQVDVSLDEMVKELLMTKPGLDNNN